MIEFVLCGANGNLPSLEPEQLVAILLLSGGFDIEAVDLQGEFGWFMRTVLWAYSGSRDLMNDERFRLISVTHYVTQAFPPAFISSGNGDPLAPQAVALARRLEELGVAVESLFFPADYSPSSPQEYQVNLVSPRAARALDRILAVAGAIVQG